MFSPIASFLCLFLIAVPLLFFTLFQAFRQDLTTHVIGDKFDDSVRVPKLHQVFESPGNATQCLIFLMLSEDFVIAFLLSSLWKSAVISSLSLFHTSYSFILNVFLELSNLYLLMFWKVFGEAKLALCGWLS